MSLLKQEYDITLTVVNSIHTAEEKFYVNPQNWLVSIYKSDADRFYSNRIGHADVSHTLYVAF